MFSDETNRIFQRLSDSFFDDDFFGGFEGSISGPHYYGYTITVGPDGKPVVKEYGNAKPDALPASDIAEMPGVEKTDIQIVVDSRTVDISTDNEEKKYHTKVTLAHDVDENSARASYTNGILQLVFKLTEDKIAGKRVEVE